MWGEAFALTGACRSGACPPVAAGVAAGCSGGVGNGRQLVPTSHGRVARRLRVAKTVGWC